MSYFIEDCEPFMARVAGVVAGVIVLAFMIVLTMFKVSPKVEVFVDEKLIYKGTDLCVTVLSIGDTTTVKTSKFYCFFPDKSYTSKDVVIRTVD